jgi:BMFP domain-containing protein YqiC
MLKPKDVTVSRVKHPALSVLAQEPDMQTDNRLLDGMARFFTNAAGAAQSFKEEMETMMKSRLERLVADLDLVPREEFDAVKAMAAKARHENEKLSDRIAALEAKLGVAPVKPARKTPPQARKTPKAAKTRKL